MSDYKDVLERIGDRVPMPEPALDRIVRRRERRHRNRRAAAAGLGLSVTVLLVVALLNGMPSSEREVVQTPDPTPLDGAAPPDLLPPAGSEPTPGGAGRLLFWYRGGTAKGMTQFLFLYEDGRLLTNPGPDDGAVDTRWVERQLTPDGVQKMLDAVAVADLPQSGSVVVPGSQGWHQYSAVAGFDGAVRWGPRAWIADGDVVADPAASTSLNLLGEQLADPAGWLPSSAWERVEPLAFVPATYLVIVEALDEPMASWEWLQSQSDLDDLPVPTGMRLPAVGGCEPVDLGSARMLVSLLDAEVMRFNGTRDPEPGYGMVWPALSGGEPVVIWIELPLPHEDCHVGPDR